MSKENIKGLSCKVIKSNRTSFWEKKRRKHEYKQGCDPLFMCYKWIWSTAVFVQTEIYQTETKSCTSTDVSIQALGPPVVYWNNQGVL